MATLPPENVFVIIIAGGSGTRLWPLSRQSRPKQFLNLLSDKTLIQETYQRAKLIAPSSNIFIVAPEKYSQYLVDYIPEFPITNFMAEPKAMGTTAAYGYTAVYIKQINPQAILHIIAADDYVKNQQQYQQAHEIANKVVSEKNSIAFFGVKPRYPDTSYGYIETSRPDFTKNEESLYRVESFHEKPNLEIAQQYQEKGTFFWHCSGFTLSVSKLLALIEQFDPQTFAILLEIEKDLKLPARLELGRLQGHYAKLVESSIENQVLEKYTGETFMVELDNSWSDVGSWEHVFEILADGHSDKNVIIGASDKVVEIDSNTNIISSSLNPVVVLGAKKMIIIQTPEVTLVADMAKSQDIKKVVQKIKELNINLT